MKMSYLFWFVILFAAAAVGALILLRQGRYARRSIPVLIVVLALALLSGCGSTADDAAEAEATPIPTYEIRYFSGNNLLQTQSLTEGQAPAKLELSLPGLLFFGWQDAAGRAVQPELVAASANADYRAVIYPLLENHVPYLFPDENGFLHPDEPLTSAALGKALRALVAPEAIAYLPSLSADGSEYTPETFRDVLLTLFPAAQVDAALAGNDSADVISRRSAAVVFNRLLGRTGDEIITLRRDAFLPPDVSDAMPDYRDLLEASVSHTEDPWGEAWSECEVPGCYAPGFLALDGLLYYIQDNGAILTDGEQNGFTFGPDGVYTCGDTELDAYVVDILRGIARENPGAEPLDLLLEAYRYARDSFTYFRKAPLTYGETGWQTEYALDMLRTLRGNCYNYAAVFWALARGLGYDATAYSGSISQQPHGWVEIPFDDEIFMFDPELEMAARERGVKTNDDRFMMTKLKASNYGIYRHQ